VSLLVMGYASFVEDSPSKRTKATFVFMVLGYSYIFYHLIKDLRDPKFRCFLFAEKVMTPSDLPLCVNGCCRHNDYENVKEFDSSVLFRCRCGFFYRLENNVLMLVGENGEETFLAKWTSTQGWHSGK